MSEQVLNVNKSVTISVEEHEDGQIVVAVIDAAEDCVTSIVFSRGQIVYIDDSREEDILFDRRS